MKNSLETRIGIFVALVVLAAVFILDIVGGPEKFTRGRRLNAMFHNVQDLKVGDRVKMAGVEIGRVEEFKLTNNTVMVGMKIRSEAGVKTDSAATIKFTGLMGQNYVSIDFGSPGAPTAIEGAIIASVEQPDLSALVAKLDNVASGVENLTKSFTGDKIDNLLGPFTDFLKANREPLTATFANLQSISAQISEGKGTVGRLIYEDTLYNSAFTTVTNLQDATDQIKGTVAVAQKVIEEVNAGQGTIGKLVKDDKLYTETTESMTNLKEILEKINQGNGTVGKLINDQEFYKNAKMTLQKLDKATDGLEDQGPLSVLGIVVSSLL
jgi:phospholipid/cholesterol/gamma-HCH transport system substrate-binding protein